MVPLVHHFLAQFLPDNLGRCAVDQLVRLRTEHLEDSEYVYGLSAHL